MARSLWRWQVSGRGGGEVEATRLGCAGRFAGPVERSPLLMTHGASCGVTLLMTPQISAAAVVPGR